MNAELQRIRARWPIADDHKTCYKITTLLRRTREDPMYDCRPGITMIVRDHDLTKLPYKLKVIVCRCACVSNELLEFMLDTLNFTCDDDISSDLLYHAVLECNSTCLDVLLVRGWKLIPSVDDGRCLINFCLTRTNEKQLILLDKLLSLGIAPRKGFKETIIYLEERVAKHTNDMPHLNEMNSKYRQKILSIAVRSIEILKFYSVTLPDVKVAECASEIN